MVYRSELRKVFADAIEDAGKGLRVFSGRHIDNLETAMPAAVVAFEEITVEQDMSGGYMYSGIISVMIVVNGDDDYLDTFVDPVIESVKARMSTQLGTSGCSLESIGYNKDIDPGVAAALITWTVDYV